MNKQTVLVALLFFALGFLIFYPALSVGFVSDDFVWLRESQSPQQYNLFDSQSLAFTKGRPGTMALFLALHKLFSVDAGWFHLIMLVFHVLNAVLLFAILCRFQLPFLFSFMAALIFLVHFANEETLFWVSCISSIFCLFLYLCAVHFYLKDSQAGSLISRAAVLVFTLIALSFREDALTVPITLLLLHYVHQRTEGLNISDWWKRSFIFFVPSIIYLGYRLSAALQESMGYQFTMHPVVWVQNGLYFILNLLVPIRFVFDHVGYEKIQNSLWQIMTASSNYRSLMLAGAILTTVALLLAVKFRNKISGLVQACVILSLAGLLLYLPLTGTSPRFLYFALVGGAILGTCAIFGLSKQISRNRTEIIVASFGIALIGLSIVVVRERSQWWIKSSQIAADIIQQTKDLASPLASDDTMYVANLPHRINGAHIFHKGGYSAWSPFEEAIALHAPQLAGRVRYLGDKDLNELQEYKVREIFTFKDGKLLKVGSF